LTESKRKSGGRIGCALAVLVAAGMVAGGGFILARMDDASRTPCQRFARTLERALANCSSGRSSSQLVQVCEKTVDPSDACMERIKELSCADLELAPATAGEVCRKRQ
jgi:hypothetical protein